MPFFATPQCGVTKKQFFISLSCCFFREPFHFCAVSPPGLLTAGTNHGKKTDIQKLVQITAQHRATFTRAVSSWSSWYVHAQKSKKATEHMGCCGMVASGVPLCRLVGNLRVASSTSAARFSHRSSREKLTWFSIRQHLHVLIKYRR